MTAAPTNGDERRTELDVSPQSRRRPTRASDLSDRELAILHSVASHRYLSAGQIQAFHFAEHASDLSAARTCRRVLERLSKRRVLGRLERRIGGVRAGSASFVYQVGARGSIVLREFGQAQHRRRYEPGLAFLEHHLAIADLHVALVEAERRGEVSISELELEPLCWRAFSDLGGQTLWLRPDLYVALTVGDETTHWFIEVDRGTESIQSLVRKCRVYEHYLRCGTEQRRIGAFPYVCWTLPRGARADKFGAALARAREITVEAHRLVVAAQAADYLVRISGS